MNPKILFQVGGLNTALKWSFDWDLWIRMAEHAAPFRLTKLSASREWGATLTASGGFSESKSCASWENATAAIP